MKTRCPHCAAIYEIKLTPQQLGSEMGKLGGSKTSPRKAKSSAANGGLGGRPKGSKNRKKGE